jgi:hypothetical protein
MAAEIYWIRDIEPLRLAVMPRPRGGDWIKDEVADWNRAGIGLVLSLLHAYEIDELALSSEPDECIAQGIEYRSLPIRDRGTPESSSLFMTAVDRVVSRLRSGTAVAVHCRAGIGRSALTAGAVLLKLGVTFEQVFPMVSRARGLTVPDTPAQIEWLAMLAKRHLP